MNGNPCISIAKRAIIVTMEYALSTIKYGDTHAPTSKLKMEREAGAKGICFLFFSIHSLLKEK